MAAGRIEQIQIEVFAQVLPQAHALVVELDAFGGQVIRADDRGSAASCGPSPVLLDEAELTGRRPERIRQAGVAIVPEGRRLLPDLTVEDNLRVASYALSRDAAQVGRTKVLELFPQLQQRLSALARTLSGGEQQMVVLAQALIAQPRYMLIDELSLGLAPVVVSRLIPVIAAIADAGTGVLLIEQFATVALGLANHAHVMEGGQIRFSGPASELRAHPELLQSAYLLRGSPDKPAAVPPPPAAGPSS